MRPSVHGIELMNARHALTVPSPSRRSPRDDRPRPGPHTRSGATGRAGADRGLAPSTENRHAIIRAAPCYGQSVSGLYDTVLTTNVTNGGIDIEAAPCRSDHPYIRHKKITSRRRPGTGPGDRPGDGAPPTSPPPDGESSNSTGQRPLGDHVEQPGSVPAPRSSCTGGPVVKPGRDPAIDLVCSSSKSPTARGKLVTSRYL